MIKISQKIKALKELHQSRPVWNDELYKLKKMSNSLQKLRIVVKNKPQGEPLNKEDIARLYARI